jgi:gliding motility-associated-like protein
MLTKNCSIIWAKTLWMKHKNLTFRPPMNLANQHHPSRIRVFLLMSALILCCTSTLHSQSDRYLHFDGVNDFAEVPNATQYFTGATGISMTGWFCSSSLGYGRGYFGFRGPGNGAGQMYVIELNAGTLECRYISSTGFNEYVAPAGTAQAGVWKHVAWTYDGTNTSLYINGIFSGSVPSTGTFTSTNRSFGIGKSIEPGFNFVFAGRIDEVTVWSKGLSQAEIQDIMANELTGAEANLELYYKMNQGIPAGNNTGITQLISEVGAGTRNANLTNFTMNGATSNFNIGTEDPSFSVSDFCQGSANQATILGTPGGTFSFQNTVVDGATINASTGSISNGVTGTTYTIQYTTSGTCPIYESHDVTVLTGEDATFNLSSFCAGATNSATGIITPGGSFAFNPDPLDGATLNTMTGEISNGISGSSYTVTYTTSGSCPGSQTETVALFNTDNPSFTMNDGCVGTALLPSTIASPGGTFSFVTDPLDGSSVDPSSGELLNGVSGSTYEIQYMTSGQCPDASSVMVSVLSSPVISNVIETCSADETSYTLSFDISDGDPSSYSVTGAGTLTGNTFTSDPISSGTAYDFTVSDANGCAVDQVTGNVMCACLAGVQLSSDISICQGDQGTISLWLSGNGPWIIEYEVNDIPQPALITAVDVLEFFVTNAGVYELISISDADCMNTLPANTSVEVTVIPLPTASISGDQAICEGESVMLDILLTGTGPWDFEYAIDGIPEMALSTASSTYALDVSQAGDYTIISVSDANCSGTTSGTAELIVNALPTASISGDLIFCAGSEASLEITLSGEANYSLTYSIDGAIQGVLNITDPSTFELLTSTVGEYELISISDDNCTGTVSGIVNISQQELPTAILQPGSFTICEGSSQTLEVVLTGNPGWTLVYGIDGVPQTSIPSTMSPLEITASNDGVYELISIADDLCTNATNANQVQIEFYPLISITSSQDVEICVGETADVWVQASGGLGGVYSYDWQVNSQVSSTGNMASYAPLQTTMVSVIINEECDYNQSFTVPITVHQLPPISVSGITEACGAGLLTLTNTTPASFVGTDCLWIIDGDSISNCVSVEYYFDLGTHDMSLEITSLEGCFNALILEDYLTVNPGVIADFIFYPQEVTTSEPLVSFINTSEGADQYLWSFGSMDFSQEVDPTFDFGSVAGVRNVCLLAENEYGCADSLCQQIRVKSDLLVSIPNSFTPDNDGVNDFFFPVLHGADESEYEFSIYDRNGHTVFKTRDIHEKWNGSYETTSDYYAADGLFMWRLIAKPLGSLDKKEYTGSVFILR